MRCLFCKSYSGHSRSVEHIIPESLGNLSHTLPAGVVCDGCNNYFARKLEKPFLECAEMIALRFHQGIPNKKGRIPALAGMVTPGFPATLRRHRNQDFPMFLELTPDAFEHVLRRNHGMLIVPADSSPLSSQIVSRFLAKVALEAMAYRLVECPDGLDYLVNEVQLDGIRNHARRGTIGVWPYNSRRIYDTNAHWDTDQSIGAQIVHEFDILKTEWNEWFFVLALFGMEFAINYGGPDIEGYQRWLSENNNLSPLYCGKNAVSAPFKPTD
jgi:hypothetical protein